MTKDEALKLALEALNDLSAWNDGEVGGHMDEPYSAEVARRTITAIKEALAQQEQEPVAWEQFYPDIGKPQIAFNAEVIGYVAPQPKQEPLAWISTGTARMIHWTSDKPAYGDDWVPLYITPPQREFVGLTDDEIEQGCKESWVTEQAFQSAVWWAEAKLKEKNNG